MPNALVIVESPAKVKTIQNCLVNGFSDGGNSSHSLSDYQFSIMATHGPLKNLKPKESSVEVDHDFKLNYQLVEKNKKHIEEISEATKKADIIFLATDPDREGDVISWHVFDILNEQGLLEGKSIKRITFYQITLPAIESAIKDAITNSAENSQALPQKAINAHHANTAINHLLNFNLSLLLSKKIRRGLSNGWEQSQALRLIVDHEQNIEAFQNNEYWDVTADLSAKKQTFTAHLTHYQSTKLARFSVNSADITEAINTTLTILTKGKLTVLNVDKQQQHQNPPAPFNTVTLLQEASRKLGFAPTRTMRAALQLYEGIDIGAVNADESNFVGLNFVSLISYIRTNSIEMSQCAVDEVRHFISDEHGAESLPNLEQIEKTSNAQAIQPTFINTLPKSIKRNLTADQFKLYDLIWKRTVASQMNHATIEVINVDLDAVQGIFRALSSTVVNPGFMSVYEEGVDNITIDDDTVAGTTCSLPSLKKGDKVNLVQINFKQNFSKPPPRFTEASLLKLLESSDIGRPVSYAPIIASLLNWDYIELDRKIFYPTDLGLVVNKFLCQHFKKYVSPRYTNEIANELDAISRGEKQWTVVVNEVWQPLINQIKNITETIDRKDVTQEIIDEKCPKCGELLSIRLGRMGQFIGCTTYPKCDYTRNIGDDKRAPAEPEKIEGHTCPECQSELIIKQGRYGTFVGCSNYPTCKHIEPVDKPEDTGIKCPKCNKGTLLKRKSRNGKVFYSCSVYPSCKYSIWNPPIAEKCPDCGWPILSVKTSKRSGTEKVCPQKSCKFTAPYELRD